MTIEPGTRVLVVGLGVSGFSAARALAALDAKVRVTEGSDTPILQQRAEGLRADGIEVELGGHDTSALDADIAVVSPGIPPAAPVMRALREHGVEVWSEIELAYRLASCSFLAVTGTNGKTTTTSLLAAMLAEGSVPALAAGNIGLPLVDAIFQVPRGGAIAVEVSSFQLAAIHRFHPTVAVVLNVAEDHMDWHGTLDDYAAAKARITANQGPNDHLVYNAGDERVAAIAAASKALAIPFRGEGPEPQGMGSDGSALVWRGEPLITFEDLSLPGRAGIEDTMAAAAAALSFGVEPPAVVRAIQAFEPLAHRLQLVALRDGISYIDDSKATNPHATLAAVAGMNDVVLIAGGRSKGIDLTPLRATVPPVRAVIALGEAKDELERVFGELVPFERAADMDEAVRRAAARSIPGGSVLLSPGCASLDMYGSYAERGEDFARSVRTLLDLGATGRGG